MTFTAILLSLALGAGILLLGRTAVPRVRRRRRAQVPPAESGGASDTAEPDRAEAELGRLAAGRHDYREVHYWAYHEDDPHRLLRELLASLRESNLLTGDEAQTVLRATRGTLYADAFEKLCETLMKKEARLSRDAYQQVDRLGRAVRQPEQLWADLEENVT